MPFKSQAQRRYMYSQHPELAAEFEAATPKGKKLPQHVGDKEKKVASVYEYLAKSAAAPVEPDEEEKPPATTYPGIRDFIAGAAPLPSPLTGAALGVGAREPVYGALRGAASGLGGLAGGLGGLIAGGAGTAGILASAMISPHAAQNVTIKNMLQPESGDWKSKAALMAALLLPAAGAGVGTIGGNLLGGYLARKVLPPPEYQQ